MTEDEVKTIVAMTVRQMKKEGMVKDINETMFEEISKRLCYHFNEGYSEEIAKVLNEIKTDCYYTIIPLYFGKHMTHEQIAEKMGVDVTTITRNKKRLCIEIYRLLD